MKTHNLKEDVEERSIGHDDFDAIYDQYSQMVYNFAYAQLMSRAAAEDVTSNVFLAVIKNLGRFDPAHGNFKAWILTITRNMAWSYWRQAHIRHEISVPKVPEAVYEEPEDESLDDPKNQATRRILAELSEREREFLAMRYAMDMTNSEIAATLGVSANAVSSRYSRLLEKCRRLGMDDRTKKRGDEGHDRS